MRLGGSSQVRLLPTTSLDITGDLPWHETQDPMGAFPNVFSADFSVSSL
jgi:hypothetical protein